jgi:hypothetical protein
MSTPNKRREMDLMKLMMSNYQVIMEEDSLSAFFVKMKGPKDSKFTSDLNSLRTALLTLRIKVCMKGVIGKYALNYHRITLTNLLRSAL